MIRTTNRTSCMKHTYTLNSRSKFTGDQNYTFIRMVNKYFTENVPKILNILRKTSLQFSSEKNENLKNQRKKHFWSLTSQPQYIITIFLIFCIFFSLFELRYSYIVYSYKKSV